MQPGLDDRAAIIRPFTISRISHFTVDFIFCILHSLFKYASILLDSGESQ